jgi:hypothetical protein
LNIDRLAILQVLDDWWMCGDVRCFVERELGFCVGSLRENVRR